MTPDGIADTVREAFAEALGRAISDADDFFAAGGDSFAAEQALTALSVRLSLDLPVWLLLDHPTVGEFAAAIEKRLGPRP